MAYTLHEGDCLDVMRHMEAGSVDAVVTDPPYELAFMGRKWDASGIAYSVEAWRECLRVLKPGGHLLAFGGTRTYHRLTCAIEDAGFEIRDTIAYMYGSGFPKSHSVNKAAQGANLACTCDNRPQPYNHEAAKSPPEHDLRQVRDADLPSSVQSETAGGEVLLSGLPEQNPLGDGSARPESETTDGEQPSLAGRGDVLPQARQLQAGQIRASASLGEADGSAGRVCNGASSSDGPEDRETARTGRGGAPQRPRPGEQRRDQSGTLADQQGAQAGGSWPVCRRCGKPALAQGLGTALKPAHEPIVVARKPLVGTVAANVLTHGTGALNIDGCRIETPEGVYDAPGDRGQGHRRTRRMDFGMTPGKAHSAGRWPANVVLDEEAAAMLDGQSGERKSGGRVQPAGQTRTGLRGNTITRPETYSRDGDSGGASRFFYTAKASRKERGEGNIHPTVKPLALMRWLVRLVTPPGGIVLDPFTGSGTTGLACLAEGFHFVGIEREPQYVAIAMQRLASAAQQPALIEVA